MMWCEMILAYDDDLKDDGVRQVVYDIGLCSFLFISG
jgi:hypothetical protein